MRSRPPVSWRAAQSATPEPAEPHEALGVLVAERVVGVVGGEVVVVEGDRAAPALDGADAGGLEAEPDLAGHVALGAAR